MSKLATRVAWERTKVWNHARQGHELGWVERGTDYCRLHLDKERDLIEVGKSQYFDVEESGVMCFTCDRIIASIDSVDDFT